MPAEALAATFSLQLAFAPREQDVSHANTFQMSAGGSRVTGNPTGHCRGALRARRGGAVAGVGVSICAPKAATLSTAPALLLPGIYCFHFPQHWKLSLITDIFMCINNICRAASQDSGVKEMRTSAPSGSSGGCGGKAALPVPRSALFP